MLGDDRHPNATDEERATVREYWEQHGVRNQFQAMLRAAEIELRQSLTAAPPQPEERTWHRNPVPPMRP